MTREAVRMALGLDWTAEDGAKVFNYWASYASRPGEEHWGDA